MCFLVRRRQNGNSQPHPTVHVCWFDRLQVPILLLPNYRNWWDLTIQHLLGWHSGTASKWFCSSYGFVWWWECQQNFHQNAFQTEWCSITTFCDTEFDNRGAFHFNDGPICKLINHPSIWLKFWLYCFNSSTISRNSETTFSKVQRRAPHVTWKLMGRRFCGPT